MEGKFLFSHTPSSKERHWNSSNAAMSLVWWNTDPIHRVSWPGMVCSLFMHLFDMTANSFTHQLIHSNNTAYLYPGTATRQKSPPFTGRHMHVHQPWSLAGPQRPLGKQERCQSLDHHTQGSSSLLLCPAQGSLSTSVFITPSNRILIKTTISSLFAGEESVMKILWEGTSRLTSF